MSCAVLLIMMSCAQFYLTGASLKEGSGVCVLQIQFSVGLLRWIWNRCSWVSFVVLTTCVADSLVLHIT